MNLLWTLLSVGVLAGSIIAWTWLDYWPSYEEPPETNFDL